MKTAWERCKIVWSHWSKLVLAFASIWAYSTFALDMTDFKALKLGLDLAFGFAVAATFQLQMIAEGVREYRASRAV